MAHHRRSTSILLTAALLTACAEKADLDTPPALTASGEEIGEVFTLVELASGVHAARVVDRPDAYAFANSLIVVGEDGVLVVDTQQSPRAARALVAQIRGLTDRPVRWVVNTHWHGDHVNGNQVYRDAFPDVRFIATTATVEAMRGPGAEYRNGELQELPGSIEERKAWLEAGALPDGRTLTPAMRADVEYSLRMRSLYLEELEELQVVEPGWLIDEPTGVNVGGRVVRLIPVGPAHTAGDLVVWLPEARVVAVGDLLEEAPPWIDGADLAGWAAALRSIRALDPRAVLPAHGAVQRDTRLLDGEAALFTDVVAAAQSAPVDPAVAHARVVAAVKTHADFLGSLGLEGERLDEWAAAAARQALAQEEVRRSGG